ncbi:MAG: DUF433 domain-containing protein [Pseudomonadota bacterium]
MGRLPTGQLLGYGSTYMNSVVEIPRVYTDEQSARLARISLSQIRYWDSTRFFEPSLAYEDRRVAFSRLYSFSDVVALRVLGELRNRFDVSLQHLRKVRDKFKLPQDAWATEELFVNRKRVYFKNERGNFVNSETDEETLPDIPIPKVITDITQEAERLNYRTPDSIGKISHRANTARKAEVFEGTRIPIDMVTEYFEEGLGVDDILEDYPTLTRRDIEAAISWLGIAAA